MATITALKNDNDTVIRDKTGVESISTDNVADLLDAVADELLARGIGIVNTTGDLATYDSADHVIALVKDYGLFMDSATGPANGDTIFAGVGGRFWLLVTRAGIKSSAGTYTPTSTDSNVASKTWVITHYMRMGNEVHMNGGVLVAATAAGATTMDFTIPVTSNFTLTTDAAGIALDVDDSNTSINILANTGASTIRLSFTAADTASHVVRFSLIYTIKP